MIILFFLLTIEHTHTHTKMYICVYICIFTYMCPYPSHTRTQSDLKSVVPPYPYRTIPYQFSVLTSMLHRSQPLVIVLFIGFGNPQVQIQHLDLKCAYTTSHLQCSNQYSTCNSSYGPTCDGRPKTKQAWLACQKCGQGFATISINTWFF